MGGWYVRSEARATSDIAGLLRACGGNGSLERANRSKKTVLLVVGCLSCGACTWYAWDVRRDNDAVVGVGMGMVGG